MWLLLVFSSNAYAGPAQVVAADVAKDGVATYSFSVTLSHADSGWDHYADKWEILDPHGAVLATRSLLHPHVDEQPFTRSLSGVKISSKIKRVTIRAHDSVHGYGKQTLTLDLKQ